LPCESSSVSYNIHNTCSSELRRDIRLLEVGAINTELLNASTARHRVSSSNNSASKVLGKKLYKLNVRSIDLHSMHESIEEIDFFDLPYRQVQVEERFDVVVCSMVINCVTKPEDRGKMLSLLYQHLRPGGYCFLTLPLLCLKQSPYITPKIFLEMLSGNDGLGFDAVETKESPKLAFYILKKPCKKSSKANDCSSIETSHKEKLSRNTNKTKFKSMAIVNKGKKFRNKFAVIL